MKKRFDSVKLRIALVASGVWLLVAVMLFHDNYYWQDYLPQSLLPLLLAWGIWWILQARKKDEGDVS